MHPETVWRPWQVASKIRETADVVTFIVRRIDDRLVKTSLPGQYVTVKVLMPDGVHQPRQYSLTRADDGEHRQFSVKRVTSPGEPDGEVSTLLHDTSASATSSPCRCPTATWSSTMRGARSCSAAPASASPRWPACSPTSSPPKSGLSITVLHADVDEASFALRRQVVSDVLALRNAALHVWYEKGAGTNEPLDGVYDGLMDLDAVDLPDDATYYLCGPLPFMQFVRSRLLERGVSPRDIQYEVFGPDLWQADLD